MSKLVLSLEADNLSRLAVAWALEYTLGVSGIEQEKDYPSTGTDRGACKFDKTKIVASVSNKTCMLNEQLQKTRSMILTLTCLRKDSHREQSL
ncbi:hypothetical protein ACOSQ4_011148 [Xanthoceras sorbifolium]